MVHDPTSNIPDGLVEFKNPYAARGMTIDEAVSNIKNFCLCRNKCTQQIQLKTNHDYYFQMQCIMYCTNREWCDLVVMTKTIHIERITFNKDLWTATLQKLKPFYFTAVLPELASPRQPVREPSEWLQQEWTDMYDTL